MQQNKLDRIEAQLRELASRYAGMVRGKSVAPPKAAAVAAKIKQLQEERNQLLQEQRKSLRAALPDDEEVRAEVYFALLKLPIIADFLYDATVALRSMLTKLGMNELTMTEQVKQMKAIAHRMSSTLDDFPNTSKILSNDDTLINALHKKVDSFLLQQIKKLEKEKETV